MKALVKYLKQPLINTAEICRVCKINEALMSQVLSGKRSLPKKHIWPIFIALCGGENGPGFIFEGEHFTFDGHVFFHQRAAEVDGHEITFQEIESGVILYKVPMWRGLFSDPVGLEEWLESFD